MPNDAAPSRRFRFSLRTSLLLLAIVAMAITIWRLYAELVPLRTENRRLRDELGELSIEDPSKFHAILTPQSDPGRFSYKWRIWVPEGRRYQLNFASSALPKQGSPPKHGGVLPINDAGEQWVEYRVFLDEESGKWHDILSTRDMSVTGGYQDWPSWQPRTGTGETVGDSTRVFNPGQPVVLARWHIGRGNTSKQIEYPSAGFMIWLEPLK